MYNRRYTTKALSQNRHTQQCLCTPYPFPKPQCPSKPFHHLCTSTTPQCTSMPLHPMSNAQCTMHINAMAPDDQCPMHNAQCPMHQCIMSPLHNVHCTINTFATQSFLLQPIVQVQFLKPLPLSYSSPMHCCVHGVQFCIGLTLYIALPIPSFLHVVHWPN